MHVSLEELLELRDGGGEARVAEHVATCPSCAAELEQLRRLREELAALPPLEPAQDHWPSLRAAAEAARGRHRLLRAGWVAAGFAAAISLLVGVRGTIEAFDEMRAAREVRGLVAESQRLEGLLRSADTSGRVVDGRVGGAIVNIEDRIAVIDSRLAPGVDRTLPTKEALNLWHERVRLLDALVAVQSTQETYVGL